MKRLVPICLLVLTLIGCGKVDEELPAPIEEPLPTDAPYVPTVYYYEINHSDTTIKMSNEFGFTPYGEVPNYDAFMKLDPIAVFYDNSDFIYVGVTASEDYCQIAIGTLYISAATDALIGKAQNSIIELSDEINYVPLDLPELYVSDEVLLQHRQEVLTGYDGANVATYALVTLSDGTEGAVCYTCRTDYMEMVVIGLDNHTCSLRNDDTELLIEDTGEVFELEFFANTNYNPYANIE